MSCSASLNRTSCYDVSQVAGHSDGLTLMENADPLLLLVSLPLVPLGLVLGKMVGLLFSSSQMLNSHLPQVKWQEPVLHFLRAHLPRLQITRCQLFCPSVKTPSSKIFTFLLSMCVQTYIFLMSRFVLPAFASNPESEGSSSAASLPPSSDPVSVTR